MLIDQLTKIYEIANKSKVLETRLGKALFRTAYFFYKRNFEDAYINLIKQKPQFLSNGNIIDVGANIGYTSILFARNISSEHKVYAIEPHPTNFKQLNENIKYYKQKTKIIPIQAAVGNYDGNITLWENPTSHADHRIFTNSFKNSLNTDQKTTFNVPIITLNTVQEKQKLINKVSFIKIDVQGYEIPVLEGMNNILKDNPNAKVCLEFYPSMIKEMGFNPNDTFDFFSNYQIYSLTKKGISKFEIKKDLKDLGDNYIDLIFSSTPL